MRVLCETRFVYLIFCRSRFFWRVKIFLRDNIFLRILCETRSKCFPSSCLLSPCSRGKTISKEEFALIWQENIQSWRNLSKIQVITGKLHFWRFIGTPSNPRGAFIQSVFLLYYYILWFRKRFLTKFLSWIRFDCGSWNLVIKC